jgi:hypothetical protein
VNGRGNEDMHDNGYRKADYSMTLSVVKEGAKTKSSGADGGRFPSSTRFITDESHKMPTPVILEIHE